MSRISVFHLTPTRRLPLIEEEGLRTRADLSERLGPIDAFDEAATGTFAHGKRISAFLDRDHAASKAAELGAGLVTFTVDATRSMATSVDVSDAAAHWASVKPLSTFLDDAPSDLIVHTNRPVRSKHVNILSPVVDDAALGDYASLVHAVADEDRLSAKALMHLAIIASEGDFDSPAFTAACALAWRDEQDDISIADELAELDPDKIASAALAEFGGDAPEATARLRQVLDETRAWGEQNNAEAGAALYARTALILEQLDA